MAVATFAVYSVLLGHLEVGMFLLLYWAYEYVCIGGPMCSQRYAVFKGTIASANRSRRAEFTELYPRIRKLAYVSVMLLYS